MAKRIVASMNDEPQRENPEKKAYSKTGAGRTTNESHTAEEHTNEGYPNESHTTRDHTNEQQNGKEYKTESPGYCCSVSETAACYVPQQTCFSFPEIITPASAPDISDLASLKAELENETDGDDRNSDTIIIIPVESDRNILLLEAPRYPEKCRRWKDIGELTHKKALETLLKQGKTPETVAAYLNCSVRQVYRAMKEHNIPTARAYAPALLEHKLNLTDPKLRLKKQSGTNLKP